MEVYVVIITHTSGTNLIVACDYDTAWECVVDYALEWWQYQFGEEPPPEDSKLLVKRYFDAVRFLEGYEISKLPVIEPSKKAEQEVEK